MDGDHDTDVRDLTLYQPNRHKFRMYEAREALSISQKTLIDWLQRAGYNLEEIVERADPNDLRQRYLASEIVEDLATRHARTYSLEQWRHIRDLKTENEQLRRRNGELELELHAVRLLLEQRDTAGQRVARPTPTRALPRPVRSPVVTRPLRPLKEDGSEMSRRERYEADLRIPLAQCPPLPDSWMAVNTVFQKHGIFIRSINDLRKQGIAPDSEDRPDAESPWRSGNNRVRSAYTPEQHLAACIRMAEKWPQRFVTSCGPKCPYPDYLARHAPASESPSESSENE